MTPGRTPRMLHRMRSLTWVLRLLPFAMLPACSSVTELLESDWRPCPRSHGEARDAACRVLGELGYVVEEGSRDAEGASVVGRYRGAASSDRAHPAGVHESDVVLTQTVEVRAAGAGCEFRVRTLGVLEEAQKHRVRNAHDRLRGRLDSVLRQGKGP